MANTKYEVNWDRIHSLDDMKELLSGSGLFYVKEDKKDKLEKRGFITLLKEEEEE